MSKSGVFYLKYKKKSLKFLIIRAFRKHGSIHAFKFIYDSIIYLKNRKEHNLYSKIRNKRPVKHIGY